MVLGAVAAFVLLTSLHGIAVFYTNYLWFRTLGLQSVWSGVLGAKLGLGIVFVVVFFVLSYVNLGIVDWFAMRSFGTGADDELVQRYRALVAPRARLVRATVSLLLALLVGTGASAEWRAWILFRNSVPFGLKDPQFHRDASFYVFKLPFLSFLVSWSLAALVVVTLTVAAASYLSGGIGAQASRPRVSPHVKAHLSVLLGLIALVKAAGYYLQRFSLDLSTAGYREGAFYADVHAKLPALTLLVIVSLFAFAVLVVNIRRQGWVLPGIAVGMWLLVSVVVGSIYPALVERFSVLPSQLSKELPYIPRNIQATRYALGISNVRTAPFAANQSVTPSQLESQARSLADVRIWDPSYAATTFQKLQDIRSYYTFNSLAVNRLTVGGKTVPVVIGARQVNSSQLPATSWVNQHLQFTHGYGAVVSPASSAAPDGNPTFSVGDVPPVSKPGAPTLGQPRVYYGPGQPGFVIANTRQPEMDYQSASGTTVESHYKGNGGVQLSSLARRAAFALRFGDLNVLISGQVKPTSRVIFMRGISSRVAKAAPFLTLDSQPYPVLLHGTIYWVQDAYTTSSHFPYGQQPNTSALPANAPLANRSFNYIRNSVKVLINSYTGKMTFYVWDPTDPIIRAYEAAFPKMFTPATAMPQALKAQLRYPLDMFTIQATEFGRYHIVDPVGFYNAGNAWSLSADPGSGSPNGGNATLLPNGQQPRMQPEYAEVQLPGSSSPSFVLLEPYVPLSRNDLQQNLTAFLVAGSDPGSYGKLTAYVTPSGQQIDGPSLVNAKINDNTAVSSEISLLDQHGSTVTQGTVMLVPVGQSLLYVRPLYVSSAQNPLPEVKEVIVVLGNTVTMEPTLAQALNVTFGSHLNTSTGTSGSSKPTTALPPQVASLVTQASAALGQGQADLRSGNLAGYQAEVNQAQSLLSKASSLDASLAAAASHAAATPAKSGRTATGKGSSGHSGSSGIAA
ncbi:MAG: UPF0182 family protein [Actinomycetota bacterium]|nr:UPF0182 family protein [Actinomycetota bacterium]